MHPSAEAWDKLHSHLGEYKHIPQDRPCDWCGKPVKEGFIHMYCVQQELWKEKV